MLNYNQYAVCLNTISANTFYLLVRDALDRHQPLSVIRIADGEKKIVEHCRMTSNDGILEPFAGFSEDWLRQYGCLGISKQLIYDRITEAWMECTWRAPSVSGITNPAYDVYELFDTRDKYVDNFFPNSWSDEQKLDLFKAAGHVIFVHGNRSLADAMQNRARKYHGVKVSWLELRSWEQADGVIEAADRLKDAPLVIFSAGPAGKYIGPRIAACGKVTLDIGAAAERWSFLRDFERAKARAVELGRLEEFTRSPYTFDESRSRH